ncbi:class I SAM-dependent methyltransferase [Calycomorphotria hydatis]|uniref:Ubiquinone biosynthesis O-methyltransferase n=1 Tax=Calycomorphotria hydatis TaxID=2528027 RepID=A0A517TCU8_9PLAN|nr:class I SAM-dependent methyltransferase [Calycomorphotria hydatis]QDT66203.1 Ubiquinone biosynthesis O-methyltransferase [Calycomorphotria hydatis]
MGNLDDTAEQTISKEFLADLREPGTDRRLEFDADSNELRTADGTFSVPVQGGIPRFVQSEHLESFGRQWTRYEVAHDDEDRATFQAKTGVKLDELAGLKVLDAGCGGGRYCKVAGEAGATVYGVDHTQAVDKATQLCAHLPNVSFVQGDLKHLPFEPGTFDFVFSIGVMHHDADTRAVFDAVAPMVKPGGRYSVWLYRRNQWWQEWLNDAMRSRTRRMNPDKLEQWCRWGAWAGGVPVMKQTLNKVVSFSNHPNYENRLCDTFDWYAPEYQFHHTVEELTGWFREAGFGDLKVLPPEKQGRVYNWTYRNNLLIGSGVNVSGVKK